MSDLPDWFHRFYENRAAGKTVEASAQLAGVTRRAVYNFCARHPAAHIKRLEADQIAIDKEIARRRREAFTG